ncbi:ABC transporter permease [Actinocatenispora comari]|uniref:ABC transporter permease n=1 Tax=Actinocatenispora comari TaxID=2807577 RepID=A0A8J4ESD9_9ACTN|nr:ABC transporter permease [Actinocatenispora comari]GIL31839.1 ABC transporter permease [Actinocatenispora comari]
MSAYLLRRVGQFLVVLVLASIAVWAMVYALPGDAATVLAGPDASGPQIAATRARLGLDKPVVVQYLLWVKGAVTGHLGQSFYSADSVSHTLAERIPATVQLAVLGMLLALLIAIPIGTLIALRPRSLLARLSHGYLTAGLAIPSFWLALLLIITLAVRTHALPATGDYVNFWQHPVAALRWSILPAIAVAVHGSCIIARFLATSLSEVMQRDFIRTVRAKGVRESRVVIRHAMRNAALPTVTVVGIQLGSLLGGTVVIEALFNYPGLGRLLYTSIGQRDYAVVQGGVLFVVVVFLVLNLLVDLLYAYLDPRIRLA